MRVVSNQRTRILDATLALMAREGTSGTSMRAVAAASGLNVATLYHYFPSKHDLCQAAIALPALRQTRSASRSPKVCRAGSRTGSAPCSTTSS